MMGLMGLMGQLKTASHKSHKSHKSWAKLISEKKLQSGTCVWDKVWDNYKELDFGLN